MRAPEPAARHLVVAGFTELLKLCADRRDVRLKQQLESDVHLVHCEDGRLDIRPTRNAAPTLAGDLQKKLSEWTGRRWIVTISSAEGEPTVRQRLADEQEARERGVLAHPAVQAVLAKFPGAEVVAVRPLAGEGLDAPAPAAAGTSDDPGADDDGNWEPVDPWDDDF